MFCRKCKGRVYVDRMFVDNKKCELFCLNCGKRWFVDRYSNVFGVWATKKEKEYKLAYQA